MGFVRCFGLKRPILNRRNYITSVEQLSDLLGDSFVIFCGSAISGVLAPYAPMVTKVEQTLLESMAHKLETGSKASRLVAKYALALAEKKGRYRKKILDTTKFEDFLSGLANSIGRHQVNELLRILYECSGEQYGPNHAAISFLLQERICTACLTTNFDNAIELSSPKDLKVLDYRHEIYRLPSKADAPMLLKLHGDASSSTCVATSIELARAGMQRHFDYLQTLLSGQKMLVVGYSGIGDVDIAPHLRASDAQLFWCDFSKKQIPDFHADQCNVLSDLSLRAGQTKNGMSNILIALAERYGWSDTRTGNEHYWQNGMKEWVKKIDNTHLEEFVISRLSWVTSWPHVHMATFKRMEADNNASELELAISFTQIAAYRSARKTADRFLNNADLGLAVSIEVQSLLGFVSWREGKFKQALETFRPLLDPDLLEQLGDKRTVVIAGTAQNYIETVLEMLQYEPDQSRRSQLIQDTGVMAVAEKLQQVNKAMGLDYLARIALYMLENFNGTRLEPVEIQAFFEECYAMEEWPSASLTTQLLLSLSFRRGMYALFRVSRKLIRRRNWKLFLKNIVAAVYAILGVHFLFLIKLLNGRTLMPFFVALIEFQCARKRRVWKRDWEKGILRVE